MSRVKLLFFKPSFIRSRYFSIGTPQIHNKSEYDSLGSKLSSATCEANNEISLFDRPKVTVPSFEFSRIIGNTVCDVVYRIGFEKAYSKESLLNGANQGALLIAKAIFSKNWNSIGNITTEDLLERLKAARERLSEDQLKIMNLSADDIVHSFLHSTVITGRKYFKLSEQGNLGIYFTIVTYVRNGQVLQRSISSKEAVGKYKKDVIAINITFARTLNPLGVWKAVAFNMFSQD